jgi:hypothetical protein
MGPKWRAILILVLECYVANNPNLWDKFVSIESLRFINHCSSPTLHSLNILAQRYPKVLKGVLHQVQLKIEATYVDF